MDFPLIYCNGDSYSNEKYHTSLRGNTYANEVGRKLNGYVLNKSITGSCNRRIVRSTVHDIIHQREINKDQPIIALIGLTFELRNEYWIDELTPVLPEESNFLTHTFSSQPDWKSRLLQHKQFDNTIRNEKVNKDFHDLYSKGRAFFYSPYAERINLMCDLLLLKHLFDSLDIKFLVFQCPKAERLEKEYLLDFFQSRLYEDVRFINLETFGFVDWCYENEFTPLDYQDRPRIGHYGPEAHAAFATQWLIPKLKELNQI
jgi:hypothetical protein